MNIPPTRGGNPEADASPRTKRRNGTSGHQDSVRARRLDRSLKALVMAVVLVAVSVAIYFLAIYPRVQNDKKLAATAAAAGKTTVTVVEPTQTSSTPEMILPGNVEGNQMTSIYSRVDGYIKKWYVDIGDHVQQGQVLADIEAPQINADLRMAQAQLKLAEANLKLAQTNSARSQQLFQNHVNSQQELDTVLA